MEVVYPCCCGLDVHKKSITACVLWAEAKGKSRKEKKRFGTFTHDLLRLADWLAECGVTHVAMESTGVYWKPVWNILAEQFEVLLVNAQHIKAVPGRKTAHRARLRGGAKAGGVSRVEQRIWHGWARNEQ
jgi:transposase